VNETAVETDAKPWPAPTAPVAPSLSNAQQLAAMVESTACGVVKTTSSAHWPGTVLVRRIDGQSLQRPAKRDKMTMKLNVKAESPSRSLVSLHLDEPKPHDPTITSNT